MKMKGKKRAGKSTDFSKRKKKLGKEKRPPENATKISFKSGSIVLPSQLASSPSQQPTGKRKLGLEALLRHLNHFKPAMRSDGLTGLRELFQDHPHLLVPNLAKLVGPVLGRLIDSDPTVRHSLRTLLGTLFAGVTPHHVQPHFPSIVAHLSCGLTHISDRVQLDSLKVFRLLLDQYPSLLPPHAQHLLPLLSGLISRQRSGSASVSSGRGGGGGKQVGLAHDPRSKLSKWSSRIDVFNLLSRFLESLLEYGNRSELSDSRGAPTIVDLESRRVVVQKSGEFVAVESSFCDFSGPVPCVMPLQGQGLPYKFAESLSTSDGVVTSPTMVATSSALSLRGSNVVFSDVSKFLEFSESLFSIILECWVECASLQSQGLKDSLVLMETIVHLLSLTLKLSLCVGLPGASVGLPLCETTPQSTTAIDVLREKHSANFSKHFLANFPLPRSSPSNNQFVQYLKMNLSLCHITSIFLSRDGNLSCQALQTVYSYYASLSRVTSAQKSISSQLMLEYSRIITDTLPQLLAVVEELSLPESCLDSLLRGVGSFYHSCHSQSSAKRCLIQCFHGLLQTSSDRSRLFSQFLLPWLESLPQLLVALGQSSPPLSAFIIHTLASATSYIPLTLLEQHMVTLLGSEGVLTQLSSLSQRRFAELLWQVPTLSPQLLGLVGEWVWSTGGRVNSSVASYLVEIVHHKLAKINPLFYHLHGVADIGA
ncbi:Testis-expressed protein 10 [Geodia barretti]|uniref:Testis-expressed protein 10 n=1 Tax=Geodia barretti TaxID=519541 RepID=A0AA35W4B7_GEOBA|nr:Testis-expressed protein 10 [Geodia barretti]